MPATIVGIPANKIPDTFDISGDYTTTLASKIAICVGETMNQEFMAKISEIAKNNGITDLCVLDEEFVTTALKNEIERRAHEKDTNIVCKEI